MHLSILNSAVGKLINRNRTSSVVCLDDLFPVLFKINRNLQEDNKDYLIV